MARPMFVRARMQATGHEFDTTENSIWIRKGLAVRVKPKLYPPSPRARRPKFRPLSLTASSAVEVSAEPTGEATTQEQE